MAIGKLTDSLLDYRKLPPSITKERKRATFYCEFHRMSLAAAMSTLATKNWQGDRFHDAEEISSACMVTLLRQEQKEHGIFRQSISSINHLQCYLSQTIWNGVKQQSRDHLRKEWYRLNHEPLDLGGVDVIDTKVTDMARRLDLHAAIEKVRVQERTLFNLDGGVIPLDGVLDQAIASAILTQVPKRTWQRYCRESRERLARALGNR